MPKRQADVDRELQGELQGQGLALGLTRYCVDGIYIEVQRITSCCGQKGVCSGLGGLTVTH